MNDCSKEIVPSQGGSGWRWIVLSSPQQFLRHLEILTRFYEYAPLVLRYCYL
jgi:hypothetical protein